MAFGVVWCKQKLASHKRVWLVDVKPQPNSDSVRLQKCLEDLLNRDIMKDHSFGLDCSIAF